jgi:transcription initiation factor IIE alpha subunit
MDLDKIQHELLLRRTEIDKAELKIILDYLEDLGLIVSYYQPKCGPLPASRYYRSNYENAARYLMPLGEEEIRLIKNRKESEKSKETGD